MTCSAWIHSDLDDAVLGIPLIGCVRGYPTVTHKRSVRAAIDIHMYRILLGLVKILRVYDHTWKFESVFGSDEHKFTKGIFGWIIIHTLHIRHNISLKDILARRRIYSHEIRSCDI